MISWIQDQLARNGRWIFVALLILLLIPFVFTIGNTPGFAGSERRGPGAEFYGVDLASRDVVDEWIIDTELGVQMESGRPPFNEQMLQYMVINRIALTHLADQLNIPEPGEREVREFVPTLALFQKPDGSYDNSAFVEFLETFETSAQINDGDLERALRKTYRIAKVTELLNGRGYAQDLEAFLAEKVENTAYDIMVAEFDNNAFDPEIEITDELLRAYFDNNLNRYEIPEKVESAWAHFSIEEVAAGLEITPTEEALTTYFDANKSKYLADKPEDLSDEEFVLSHVREQVEIDYLEQAKQERARSVVEENASVFAYDLYTAETAFESEEFNGLLEKYGVSLAPLGTVGANDSPMRLGSEMPRDIVPTLHGLSEERYYTDALRLTNGDMGVFFLKNRIAAEFPAFETVESRVRSDYRRAEKDRLFAEKGQELSAQFSEVVSEGGSFSDAVYSSVLVPELDTFIEDFLQGAALVDIASRESSILNTFDAVKGSDRREGLVFTVTSALSGMEAGDVSPMLTAGSKGYFVYVTGVEIPEVDPEAESLITRVEQIEARMAGSFGRAVMSDLIEAGSPDTAQ